MNIQKEEEGGGGGEEAQHAVVTLFTSNRCTWVDKRAKYRHQRGCFFTVSDDNNTIAVCSTWTAGRAKVYEFYHTHKQILLELWNIKSLIVAKPFLASGVHKLQVRNQF